MNHAAFAQALLDPALPAPGGQPRRFAVYRNNVAVSLCAALADGFPVVAQLVGERFFSAMARVFIARHPPASPVLVAWGDDFADFIAGFPPAASLPYLADVARLERLRVRAFHAAEAPPLPPDTLARALAHPETLPLARLRLQPGLGVCVSDFAAVSIWAAHQQDGEITLPDDSQPRRESALVLREGQGWTATVSVLPVPPATAGFVRALLDGAALKDAVASADCATAPRLDLASSLGLLIRHQAIVAWQQPEEAPP